MTIQIVPSILAADFANLEAALRAAEAGGAEAVQIDVMDGHFVPNLTIGAPVVAALRKVTGLTLDVHLMIENPGDFVEMYAEAGADILTVHVEACTHLHRVIHQIKEAGMKAGAALNPATPLVTLDEILDDLDVALLMTVNPGFGGQKFIHSMLPKIRRLRGMLEERGLEQVIVEVDGGVNEESAPLLGAAGAEWLVAGSAVYGRENVGERIARLKRLAEEGRDSAKA
ncbi:MAG TPA: ribulose-phosphate 3-epimerase [Ardenticatenaceae bacterium]